MSQRLAAVKELKLHPQASLVPSMREAEFAEFVADIRERQIKVPIELQPGTNVILDGRCRWLAAKKIKLDQVPVIDAPVNGDDPVVYMLRAASQRRHLTDDQRGAIGAEEADYLGKKQRAEQAREVGKKGGRGHKKKTLGTDAVPRVSGESKRARAKAAKHHNVSERKIRENQKLRRTNKRLAEDVKNGKTTLARAKRQAAKEAKRKELEAKAKQAKEHMSGLENRWEIRHGDCLEQFGNLERGSVRLIFADPPYNIGVDYGPGKKADQLPEANYLHWCAEWIGRCHELLAADGSLWLLINHENAAAIEILLKSTYLLQHKDPQFAAFDALPGVALSVLTGLERFHLRAWITVYETFGQNQANNFNRCSRRLFYCVKDPAKFVFHADAVNRPSDRQAKYGDARAEPGGKIWDDVWQIPRLVGTATERIPDFPTQLPLRLLTPIVACCSDPGDLVFDPFSGSATAGEAALRLGRRFLGVETSKDYAKRSRQRLAAVAGEIRGNEKCHEQATSPK